jgi:hypothetical protein
VSYGYTRYAAPVALLTGSVGEASSRPAFPPGFAPDSRIKILAFGFARFAKNAVENPLTPPPTTTRS